MANKGVSLRPSDASTATGILNDVDADIIDAKFQFFDYRDKQGNSTGRGVGALVTFREAGRDDASEQFYSAGDPDHFSPSSDGKRLIPNTEGRQLSLYSNFMDFINSVCTGGYPESMVEEDISFLVGMNVHLLQKEQRKREGLGGKDAKARTIPLVTKINNIDKLLGGTSAKGKGKAAAAGNGAATDEDTLAAAIEIGTAVLKAEDGSFDNPKAFSKAAFTYMLKAKTPKATRDAVQAALASSDFLESNADAAGWVFSDGVVALNS